MPIETVNISYHEPEPTDPEVPFEDPVIREYNTSPEKLMMIHLNKRISRMTVADLRKYRLWVERVPRILRAYSYHPNFIEEFYRQANNLADIIQTRINAAGTVSPDLHD